MLDTCFTYGTFVPFEHFPEAELVEPAAPGVSWAAILAGAVASGGRSERHQPAKTSQAVCKLCARAHLVMRRLAKRHMYRIEINRLSALLRY
jgi:hypothetical protein